MLLQVKSVNSGRSINKCLLLGNQTSEVIPIISRSHIKIPLTSFLKEIKLLTAVMFHIQTIAVTPRSQQNRLNRACSALTIFLMLSNTTMSTSKKMVLGEALCGAHLWSIPQPHLILKTSLSYTLVRNSLFDLPAVGPIYPWTPPFFFSPS